MTPNGSKSVEKKVVPCAIKILGPNFNVAVDAIGPKMDFTLEPNRKKEEKLL